MLEVLSPGPLATVQDLGRTGYAELGVPRAGALDGDALRLGNRLVGNPAGAAGIEFTYGTARLRARTTLWCALTGAPGPATAGGRPAPYGIGFALPAGAELVLGAPVAGIRGYLAVAGGVAVTPVLGSRSTDTLAGLGPPPLRAGDVLPVGAPAGPPGAVDFTPVSAPGAHLRLRVRFGPRDDWFTAPRELLGRAYTVGEGDRIGVRLRGPALARARTGELPSEGLLAGAVQVPGDGQPLVFLADHPTTGGYPVVAVVHPADLGSLAQARPGTTVTFHGSQR
ncbi:allophanate hydrolase [Catellatospora sp. TT07R-123]|uniref:5-oxoprolinase subunit C family protein n=1 Tax=Catellatospora sp. TT07R-123 TaxID=2733863 RepID=UPI001B0D7DEA|nr:biotin-dependent carboxyltransferase family protein [Catellatospora sp. TT07R-123]GHJ46570.1 allophanate hydrolase [Catellatospora sp. TT07R-123]